MAEPICPICGGTGFRIVDRNGVTGAERCECARRSRGQRIWESAGIPRNYQNDSLENFSLPSPDANPIAHREMAGVLVQVRNYAMNFPDVEKPGLLLVGDPGTGKTHLAVAALRILVNNGHEGVFFDYQNLLDKIRSSYDAAAGASDKEAYRDALEAEVLLLDDLGAHRVTEWVEDTVTSLITFRCNNRKPLIATTNLPDLEMGGASVQRSSAGLPGQMEYRTMLVDRIGTRARSRLFEMCRIVRMPKVADYRVSTSNR
jgi:DNA replication protein DnaC